ncbi:DUF3137 domain-containing protein [Phytoactinopolyspora alkaliphila]|uniref:DUF3137 domain-containing protein n=1 Tax=Phytoactinopolyspora alkaliphila TaxID=1783498 RepID=A0A6N9YG80_9ACTN|nr:DUF3137 domain-containing protein [Phytoactinopolyspora alkaliphila]NED93940.1 DUF3137 domain-containing protein [Phytoactinopolyspora alkaliphila]
MESMVALLIAGGLAVAITVGIAAHGANKRRTEDLQALAAEHGWEWDERQDGLAGRWHGAPFRGHWKRAKARSAISGTHRRRPFVAFEYSYTTTTSTGQTTSTTTHRYGVWVITLPAALPAISLGAEGVLGGRLARTFGFGGVEIGDPEFETRFKVKSDDHDYAFRVLHPDMVRMLMDTGTWAWRIDGDAMISYVKGRLEAEALVPRLELMHHVIDQIPRDVWDVYGRPGPS